MTGISNHHKRNAPVPIGNVLGVVGALLQIIIALLVIVGVGLHWAWKRLYKQKG